jgi:magnesium chelatase family protein
VQDTRRGEPSASVRARVAAARARQAGRLAGSGLVTNGEMGPAQIRDLCRLDPPGQALLSRATQQLGLSARGYHRVLKLARTIADLAAADEIALTHVAEALQYRPRALVG